MIRRVGLISIILSCLVTAAALISLGSTELGGAPGMRWVSPLVIQAQRVLVDTVGTSVDRLKTSGSAWPLLVLFGVSFLYGVLHAVGPGHGKVVISSYLVAKGSQLRRGLIISVAAALVQAASAIVIVAVLSVVLHLTRFEINNEDIIFQEGSYGLIVLVGIWMLFSCFRAAMGTGHDHAHHVTPSTAGVPGAKRAHAWRGYSAVVLATGTRPCSGAILVLLFTLAQGVFLAGIGATFVMALGTAVTISGLAILAVLSRKSALRIAHANAIWQARIHTSLAVLSSILVITAGLLLLLATANQGSSL